MELDRHFAWFEAKLPAGPARFVSWLRKPSSRYVRIPIAILLILGGIFSILPVLGLWMLPLGLLLFAQDVPFLQPPMAIKPAASRKSAAKTCKPRKPAKPAST